MKVTKLERAPSFDPYSKCKFTTAGNTLTVLSSSCVNHIAHIRKLNAEQYLNLNTGEINNYNHWNNRSDGITSVSKSITKLRDIINANATIPENLKWVTLTYAENMTDVKRLYRDFDKFFKRFKYHYEKKNKEIPQYIAVIEPQARGAWHLHILFIWEGKAPYLPNDEIASIWKHGFSKTKAVNNVDNLGAYFSAYLANLPLEECADNSKYTIIEAETEENGQKVKKKFVKGARLNMYPVGVNLYRTSRGIKKPTIEHITKGEANNRVKNLAPQYTTALQLTDEVSGLEIFIEKIHYNIKRHIMPPSGSEVKNFDGQRIV